MTTAMKRDLEIKYAYATKNYALTRGGYSTEIYDSVLSKYYQTAFNWLLENVIKKERKVLTAKLIFKTILYFQKTGQGGVK